MKMEKENRGGARAGAGRKPGPKKILRTYSVYPEDAEIIRNCAKTLGISSSEVIHELIRAYEEKMS